jgi:hypothetical protein
MFTLLLFYIESYQVVTWLNIGVSEWLSLSILKNPGDTDSDNIRVTYSTSGASITNLAVQRGETMVLYLYSVI